MRTITVSGGAVVVTFNGATDAPAQGRAKALAVETVAWYGDYRLDIAGKTDDEVLAEVNRIQIHHDKKSARLTGFADLVVTPVIVGGVTYQWKGCTIREVGKTDVELFVTVTDPDGKRPSCMPLRVVYANVDDIPNNTAIRQYVTDAIAAEQAAKQAANDRAARLSALLG